MGRKFGSIIVIAIGLMMLAGCGDSNREQITLPVVQVDASHQAAEVESDDTLLEAGQDTAIDTSDNYEQETTTGEEVFEVDNDYGIGGTAGDGTGLAFEEEYTELEVQAYEEYVQHMDDLKQDIIDGYGSGSEQTVSPANGTN